MMQAGCTGPQPAQGERRVRIVTPFFTDYCDAYKQSLLAMQAQYRIKWSQLGCRCHDFCQARNTLINGGQSTTITQTLDPSFSHYLFVDWNVSWHLGAIERLLDVNMPIVSAAYRSLENPHAIQAGEWDMHEGNPGRMLSDANTKLLRVDWCGPSFLLVERQALERMQFPWWRHHQIYHAEEIEGSRLKYHCIEVADHHGFCIGAKAAGINVFVDCGCWVTYWADEKPSPLKLVSLG